MSMLPSGGEYGSRKNLRERQAAQPVAGDRPAPPRAGPPPAPQVAGPGVDPGTIPSLQDPSALPDQPVQSGLPMGPGSGADALLGPGGEPAELGTLRALYGVYPYESLRRLIQWSETNLTALTPPQGPAVSTPPPQLEPGLDPEGDASEATAEADLLSTALMGGGPGQGPVPPPGDNLAMQTSEPAPATSTPTPPQGGAPNG